MRNWTICAVGLMLLASPAMAQMGGGGGMGGGGMGGGGMGGMGGGRGGMGGGAPTEDAPSENHHPVFHPHEMKAISQEKYDKAVTAMFNLADVNHDGMVTIAELQSVIDGRRDAIIRARFQDIDTNHNGTIDLAEFIAWQNRLGSRASSDCAGYVSQDELIPETLGPPLGSGEQDQAIASVLEPLSALMITRANTHYRAGLGLDDLLTYENQRFAAVDTDHDGYLEQDEIEAANHARADHDGGPSGHGWHHHHEGGSAPER